MSADVIQLKQRPVKGTAPKPDMWQCRCGSQVFKFTHLGDVWCVDGCGRYICNLVVKTR